MATLKRVQRDKLVTRITTMAGSLLTNDMRMKKSRMVPMILAGGLILLGAGCSWTETVNVNVEAKATKVCAKISSTCLRYAGQDGKNALELLKAKHKVEATAQGFVTAINSIKPDSKHFWSFYVNGQAAQVGAKDYQTKKGETIEWKLETITP